MIPAKKSESRKVSTGDERLKVKEGRTEGANGVLQHISEGDNVLWCGAICNQVWKQQIFLSSKIIKDKST